MTDTATALAQAARTIYAEARAHKREERRHRVQARELMQKLDELQRACASLGISVQVDTGKEPQ